MKSMHLKKINDIISGKMLINEPMCKHTTFGIGGPAACYINPENKLELKSILEFAAVEKIPVFFIGSGSNLLVSDEGFDGIVISLAKTFKKLNIRKSGEISAESGVMLGHLVRLSMQYGITGMESLIGIPGTLGGALVMNAGAYGSEISNYFQSALVMTTTGEEKEYTQKDINFGYRFSTFSADEIITEVRFKCSPGEDKTIKGKSEKVSRQRKSSQPLKYRSAGSIFKNPSEEISAGYLIDKSGLKGTVIGDAEISQKHANFIINNGKAKAVDVIDLIKSAHLNVVNKFQINLELEIKLLGFEKDILTDIYYA